MQSAFLLPERRMTMAAPSLGFKSLAANKKALVFTNAFCWRRKRDIRLPSCGARKICAYCLIFRPLRQILLASSATGSASAEMPTPSSLGFKSLAANKKHLFSQVLFAGAERGIFVCPLAVPEKTVPTLRFSDRCAKFCSLHLPQAALRRICPRLRRSGSNPL